ncbi:unnamed protein product [Brassicogethes aeneus]|uniref:Uncharacterized protein n=1 Tax=Brassicogethes aeneus TaxID=1431903 RepID=A0A9P0BJI1_BRAAE|nr:unnamed protein product [Brassicogethes aeneus]
MEKIDNNQENGGLQEVVYQPTTTTNGPLKSAELRKSGSGYLYLTAFIANVITFSSGMAIGWSSPVIPKLSDPEHSPFPELIQTSESSLIAGILFLGCAFGPFIFGKMANKVGRKFTLLGLSVPFIISYLFLAYTSSVYVYYVTRFMKGLSIGGGFAVMPMYLGEIAEDHNRGMLGCLAGVAVTSGILNAFLIGPYLSIKLFCLSCAVAPILFFALGYFILPESPVFLASKGDKEGVRRTLMKLRSKSSDEVQAEVSELMKSCEGSTKEGGYKVLFSTRGNLTALKICFGLLVLQQLSGINAIQAFLENIFKGAGGSIPSEQATVIIGVLQVFINMVTTSVVERLGRKSLLLISTVGSFVSITILGAFFYLQGKGHDVSNLSWLPIVSLMAYIIGFNLGLGCLPWVLIGETFASNVKFQASTFLTCMCFIFSFLITMFFPIASKLMGMALTFWTFGVCCAFGIIFVVLVVPETKGKSLSEIQIMLNK